MATLHFKSAALYLGDPAAPIGEATEARLEVELDDADDSAFTDAWDTRLKGPQTWAGAAQANFDTASSQLFDVAVATTASRMYLYPVRGESGQFYHGRCWPKLGLVGSREDAGRLTAAWVGTGPLSWVARTAYQQTILGDTPYLYLPLNESSGTGAADLSGNDRGGTYAGSGITYRQPSCVPESFAVTFDGAAGNIDLSTPLGGFAPSPVAFTLEFWIKPDSVTGTYYLFDAGLSPRFLIRIVNGSLQHADNSGFRVIGALTANVCQHVAIVVNSPVIRAYVNASPDSAVNLGSGYAFGTPFAAAVKFGSAWDDGAFFAGTASDLAVYDYALTGTQILAHYNAA